MKTRNFAKTTLSLVALALLAAGSAQAALIAHWKLDEGSGTTAVDSANSNNGTLTSSPTWTTSPNSKVGADIPMGCRPLIIGLSY